jgi:hypothetical protein
MPSKSDNLPERLDRVEAILERFAEESANFQLTVRGAITAQQEQIAEHSRQIAENSRMIRELAEITRENSRNWEQLRREFEAYLRRSPQ